MKIIINFFLTALAFGIYSCSDSPNIDRVESDLRMQIEKESDGAISLIQVKEINSIDQEVFEVKSKTIHFVASIKFNRDCYIYINKSGASSFFPNFQTFQAEPEFYPSLARVISFAKMNDEINFEDSYNYFETNQGWTKQKANSIY